MAQLQQMNINFDPVEDRLLLKIRADDSSEVRLWLTRRYVKLLWGVLKEMVEDLSGMDSQQGKETREAMLAFQHEEALTKTDFNTAYRSDADSLPLGDNPVLVTKIQRRAGPNGTEILRLAPQDDSGIEVTCDANMLHSICRFLSDGVSKTDWNLDLVLFDSPMAQMDTITSGATRH